MGGKPSFETGKGATFAAAVFFVFEIVAATASAEAAAAFDRTCAVGLEAAAYAAGNSS